MSNILTVAFLSFLSLSEINYDYLFHHYQNQFDKSYSVSEYNKKFEVFKDNVDFMFKNRGKNYTLNFNQYTDLTNNEFKNKFMFNKYNVLL